MIENRKYVIQAIIILIGIIFLGKLFSIQVLETDYKLAAENNIIEKEIKYPYRGLVYDRNDNLIVYNAPVYDITVTPSEVQLEDTVAFCNLFNITPQVFEQKMQEARAYSRVKSSVFIKQLSNEKFARIQDLLVNYPGFQVQARTHRAYTHDLLANTLGYIGEISKSRLNRDTSDYYNQGDYIGISGLEATYEDQLRGKRGVEYKMVNVRGINKGSFKEGTYDTMPVPGKNLTASIDLDLQQYGEKLLEGKVGSIVAIEPSSGEILSMVSSPSYDPSLLASRDFSKNFSKLQSDSLVPLFNRPIMAMYPPGSIFKTVQTLIALEEGVVTPSTTFYCDGSLVGDHVSPGYYNLFEGLKLSSNQYFYKTFRRLINRGDPSANPYKEARKGLETWRNYVSNFGLGQKLGVDIPNEKSGYIPSVDYYDKIYGEERWKFSNIYSLSIGQGEMMVTPLQMANLAAIIANKGYYYIPHIIKGIGEEQQKLPRFREKQTVGINNEHFEFVHDAMEAAIQGTAMRAHIPDIAICGKTGTSENPHGADHSVFMAFAPKEDPQIAISVYVENAGWGGRAAASTASLMIEKYLRGHITKKWLEEYVLKGDFLDEDT